MDVKLDFVEDHTVKLDTAVYVRVTEADMLLIDRAALCVKAPTRAAYIRAVLKQVSEEVMRGSAENGQ